MKILIDSHIFIWYGYGDLNKMPKRYLGILEDSDNDIYFSLVTLWELMIKYLLGKPDFNIDSQKIRLGLIKDGFNEMPILNQHIKALQGIPSVHKDPFDRLLIAQAKSENCQFLTVDEKILQYPYDFIIQ